MTKRQAENMSLGNVLKEFIETNRLQDGLDKVDVARIWNNLMGPAIQKYTTHIQLDRHTLYVRLSSSVLREELSYGKQKIITMINEELGKELVKELVLG